MSRAAGAVKVELSGIAKVYCVHDREKRLVRDPELVKFLGQAAGIAYDPKLHKLQDCGCCENLHVTLTDTPQLCSVCSKPPTHALGGPIAEPIEGVI